MSDLINESNSRGGKASTEYEKDPVTRQWNWLQRIEGVSAGRFALMAALGYVVVSLAIYFPQLPLSTHSIVWGPHDDAIQEVWFLKWTPWAILHGHNPFFTNWMDYPLGIDLAANTSFPGLALLAWPITQVFGAVASYNFMMWLSFPLSAFSCFFVVRKWTKSNIAAVVAGALYGFSPYMTGQGAVHVFLVFAPLPPLFFLSLYQIVVAEERPSRRWSALLVASSVGEYFISQEVLADTIIVALLALIIVALANVGALTTRRISLIMRSIVTPVGAATVILAYPLYQQLWGSRSLHSPLHGGLGNSFKTDLLAPIIPGPNQWWDPSIFSGMSRLFAGGGPWENGGYIGVPFLIMLGYVAIRWRRDRWIQLLSAMVLLCVVISFGKTLAIGNQDTGVPLPWSVIGRIPIFSNDLTVRFTLLTWFFCAVLMALGVSRWLALCGIPEPLRRDSGVTSLWKPHARLNRAILTIVLVASTVTLLPNWPIATYPMTAIPAFFTSDLDSQIPQDSVVLTFPMDSFPSVRPEEWQVASNLRWRMVGGVALIPGPGNSEWHLPPLMSPAPVLNFLENWSGSGVGQPTPPVSRALVNELVVFLRNYSIQTLLLDPNAANSDKALSLLVAAFGPPKIEGGMDVWIHPQATSAR